MKKLMIIGWLIVFFFIIGFIGPTFNPPGKMGPYLNRVFPSRAPGADNAWSLVPFHENIKIPSPLQLKGWPLHDNKYAILSKIGELHLLDVDDGSDKVILDIKDRTFKKGEGGSVSFVFHYNFGDVSHPKDQYVLIFYRYKLNPDAWDEIGYNRLSKFYWDDQTGSFDADSEEILIQQYDRATWHNGGGLSFDNEGYLLLALGDEGFEEMQQASTQRLDGGFFSGVLRIDVDNDSSRSHPIRRQPVSLGNPPSGWPSTFSQGYMIPDINPWLDVEGGVLEEFIAVGTRSPFSSYYDTTYNEYWIADVGSDLFEEINVVSPGDNLQWPYIEGDQRREDHSVPTNLIGDERIPIYKYDRDIGSCVIGALIYTDEKYPSLTDHFLYGDYTVNTISALAYDRLTGEVETRSLIANLFSQPVDLPTKPGVSGIYQLRDGRIIVSVMGEDFTEPVQLMELIKMEEVADPPSLLSELNVFENLKNLEVVEGILPYDVNAPLWSDGALKSRWVALPNDGKFDEMDEQIIFKPEVPWTFPEGTVFIKHFDLPVDTDQTRRLETRFFIIGERGVGYGLTYKWNEDQTDAELINRAISEEYIVNNEGEPLYNQVWTYPSRTQCVTCHTGNAGFVLGFNTHQLNRKVDNLIDQDEVNQLSYFNQINAFTSRINSPSQYLKSYSLEDSSVSLTTRIRSYLDSNCSSCHRSNGLKNINLDLRYSQPFLQQSMIEKPTESHASDPSNNIVTRGDHTLSELWIRDNSVEKNKMPPIGRSLVDHIYIDSLTKWIDNLDINHYGQGDISIFPSPMVSQLVIITPADISLPLKLVIYSSSGKMMYQDDVEQDLYSADVNAFPGGVYFVQLRGEDYYRSVKVVKR